MFFYLAVKMVRNYVKKSTRGSWSKSDLIKAINEVMLNTISCNSAANKFNIPEATLRRYINLKSKVRIFLSISIMIVK